MSSWIGVLSPYGRTGRGRFWELIGAQILLILAFVVLALTFRNSDPSLWITAFAVCLVGSTVLGIAGWATFTRRCHDRGKSGLWIIVALVLETVGDILTVPTLKYPDGHPVGSAIVFGVVIWFIVDLGLMPGTKGPNRYGQDPREETR